MLTAVLLLSILLTVYIIKHTFSLITIFHWLELISITFFVLGVNTWSFDFYLAAYPSLDQTQKYLDFAVITIHFVVMYPLLFVWVLGRFKSKKSPAIRYGWAFLWFAGYELLLYADVCLGVFKINGPYWIPLSVTIFYNLITFFTSMYLMRKIAGIINKEGKQHENDPGPVS